jgi:hypothetical protein
VIGPILKVKLILTIILLLVFLMLFTNVATHIDFTGQGGAFMAGIFLSGLLGAVADTTR